jgi:hypothetical protein
LRLVKLWADACVVRQARGGAVDHHCSSTEVMRGGDLIDALTRVDPAEQSPLRDRRPVVQEDPGLGEPHRCLAL